jgi:hypothetical protein
MTKNQEIEEKMKNKIKRTLEGVVIGSAILMGVNQANGQNIHWVRPDAYPSEPVNVFISQYQTPQSDVYDKLTTKKAKDDLIQYRISSDWLVDLGLACNPGSLLGIINSIKFKKDIKEWEKPLYDGFSGVYDKDGKLLKDSILAHLGTL